MPVSGSKIRSGVTTHSREPWRRLDWRWIWKVQTSCLADWGFSVWPPCSSCTAKRQRWFWRRSVHALLLYLARVSPRLVSSHYVNYSVHCIAWSVSVRMVRQHCCVFINYNWVNQLSNTTIWWLDICCLLHRYQLHVSALMAIFRLTDLQQTCKQLYFGMRLVYGGGGLGLDGGTRSRVCFE